MLKRRTYRIVSVVLVVIMLSGCVVAQKDPDNQEFEFEEDKIGSGFSEGNRSFNFKIFRELNKEDGDENVFISPFSIASVLSMLYNGAQTTTKDAMADVLGFGDITLKEVNEGYRYLLSYLKGADPQTVLDMGNSIWIRKGFEVDKDFINRNEDFYKATVESLDFNREEAAQTINKWIDEATRGKISKMVESPIDPLVVMYLANAIYFKGEWTEKFDIKDTRKKTFHNLNGEKAEVDMMSKHGGIYFGTFDGGKVVRLPYGKEKMAMYVILPDEGLHINEYINGLDNDQWLNIIEGVAKRTVTLEIPKFKIEYGIKSLNDSLSALGMEEAFREDADFSSMAEDVYISSILHKAVIEVNEEGSEAVAATVGTIVTTSMPVTMEFIADRPFVFLIVEEESDTILFMGKVVQL